MGNLDFLSDPATLNQAHVVNNPCFVVVLPFFLSDFFFSACLAVTANTIRDLCAPCKQRLCEFCASRPTARSLRRRRIDFYSKACNDSDDGTLFRASLHRRSRDACRRSRLKCKNVTNGADYREDSAISRKNTI